MKKIIMAFSLVMYITLAVLIIMTVDSKSIRQAEIESSLKQALDTAIDSAMSDNSAYTAENEDECIANFLQNLCLKLESNSDIRVNILDISEKGLMTVEVTAKFKNAGGRESTVSSVKTMIYEKTEEEGEIQTYEIIYNVEGEVYKTYGIEKENVIIIPPTPDIEGKTFKHWTDNEGNIITDTYIVRSDLILTAVFE